MMTLIAAALLQEQPGWLSCLEDGRRRSRAEDRPLLIYSIDDDG
jgi:hypothetical protein